MPTVDLRLDSALNGPGHTRLGPGGRASLQGQAVSKLGGVNASGPRSRQNEEVQLLRSGGCADSCRHGKPYRQSPTHFYGYPPITILRVCKRVQDST